MKSSAATVSSLTPNQWYFTWFFSTPIPTSWQLASFAGTLTVTVPASLTGNHRVIVQDANGQVFGWAGITVRAPAVAAPGSNAVATPAASATPKSVTAAQLSATGVETVPALLFAAAIIALGLGIFARSRRRITGRS